MIAIATVSYVLKRDDSKHVESDIPEVGKITEHLSRTISHIEAQMSKVTVQERELYYFDKTTFNEAALFAEDKHRIDRVRFFVSINPRTLGDIEDELTGHSVNISVELRSIGVLNEMRGIVPNAIRQHFGATSNPSSRLLLVQHTGGFPLGIFFHLDDPVSYVLTVEQARERFRASSLVGVAVIHGR
jgi:hypothetical protein